MNKDEMIKRFKAVTPEIDAILNNPKSKEKVNALHHPEHASALQDLYKVIDQITAKPYVEIPENESYMLELAISWVRYIKWPPEPKKESDPVITEEMVYQFEDNLRARGIIH